MIVITTNVIIISGSVLVNKTTNIKCIPIAFETPKGKHRLNVLNIGEHKKLFNQLYEQLNQKANQQLINMDIVLPNMQLQFYERYYRG